MKVRTLIGAFAPFEMAKRSARVAAAGAMLSLAPVLTALAADPSPTLERIKSTKSMVLAVRETSNPFAFNNGKDQFIGYSVELCEAVAKGIQTELGLPEMGITYVPVTGAERLEVITKDFADIECSTTSITRKRLESVSFSVATFYSASVLVGRKGSVAVRAEDLAGKRVAVGEKTIQETWLKGLANKGVKVEVETYKNPNDGFLALLSGRADFFATDDLQAISMLDASEGNKAKAGLMDLRFLPNTYGLMLSKADPAFKEAVDRQLRAYFASGASREAYRKWFERPIPPTGKAIGWAIPAPLEELFLTPSDAALID